MAFYLLHLVSYIRNDIPSTIYSIIIIQLFTYKILDFLNKKDTFS